jgi:hypothetical protein
LLKSLEMSPDDPMAGAIVTSLTARAFYNELDKGRAVLVNDQFMLIDDALEKIPTDSTIDA